MCPADAETRPLLPRLGAHVDARLVNHPESTNNATHE